jgi:hypothetical protein
MSATHTDNFFQDRMDLLGITPDINKIVISDPEAEFPQPDTQTWPLFAEEKSTGDIMISYFTIDGEAIRYTRMGDGKSSHINASIRYYETRRLKEPKGDMKYQMPAGQPTKPWFPPALVQKFKEGEKVSTIILTEGVFKAMRGSMAGLDVVGLPSITCYKEKDGKLYSDIHRLIEKCQVENVIILWDGDCLKFSKKDLQVGDEITNRPATFFNSAKKIAELLGKLEYQKTREKVSVWFSHVKSDCLPSKPKGLDDLLIDAAKEGKEDRVVHELRHIGDKGFFFFARNITTTSAALYKYFRIDDAKSFYDLHGTEIESREFKFKGSVWRWSEVNNELEMQAPEWAERVKWVGDEFFLEDVVPGAVRSRRKLIAYKQGQFTKMFGYKFWEYLPHHKAFCNIPDHFNYRQIIETEDGGRYYNRYFPFPHVPQEGSWNTILEFLKHIFGAHKVIHSKTGKEYDSWELGIDYIQILLTKPTQMLPVLCLFSPENNTGKSTLGKLLMHMFGDNAVPIGNSDLQSEFNEMFVDKLLAICDETLLERKRDAERIKAMSTAEQIMVNPKGQKQYSIDYFCKFLFTSNNIRMVYVSKHDERYWIIKVPRTATDNPRILDEMSAEIPAFVHYLVTRKLVSDRESRMHFHPSLIKTNIFKEVVQVNEPTDATNLREQLREWFIQDSELTEIRMTLKEIRNEFFSDRTSVSWINEILKDYLCVDLVRNQAGESIFERGTYTKFENWHNATGEEEIRAVKKPYRGRPYQFLRSQFVAEGEVNYSEEALDAPGASANALTHPKVIQTAMELEAETVQQNGSDDLPF